MLIAQRPVLSEETVADNRSRFVIEPLEPAEEIEEDLLDKAWGLEPNSRLGCQAIVGKTPLVVEIPKYSINMAKEGHRK